MARLCYFIYVISSLFHLIKSNKKGLYMISSTHYYILSTSISNSLNVSLSLSLCITPCKVKTCNVLRLALHSLGSGLWGDDVCVSPAHNHALSTFLYVLRGLLRSSLSVAMVTVPTHLIRVRAQNIYVSVLVRVDADQYIIQLNHLQERWFIFFYCGNSKVVPILSTPNPQTKYLNSSEKCKTVISWSSLRSPWKHSGPLSNEKKNV